MAALLLPGRIDNGVATVLLPRPDRQRDGRPSSPPAGFLTSQPPFFSSCQIRDLQTSYCVALDHGSPAAACVHMERGGRMVRSRCLCFYVWFQCTHLVRGAREASGSLVSEAAPLLVSSGRPYSDRLFICVCMPATCLFYFLSAQECVQVSTGK